MNSDKGWKENCQAEINGAVAARARGNEGMARVCARRAAGVIIGEYLHRKGFTSYGSSVVDRMSIFNALPDIDLQSKEIASHFLLKVDPEHHLPVDVDLVNEVAWLSKTLLSEDIR